MNFYSLTIFFYHPNPPYRRHLLRTGCPDHPWVVTECRLATTESMKDPFNPKVTRPVDGTEVSAWELGPV